MTEGLGTVSAEGVFHAQRAGSGKPMAALGKAQQAMDIQVEPGPLATLALVPASLTTAPGQRRTSLRLALMRMATRCRSSPPGEPAGMIGQIDPARGTFQATTAGAGTVVAVLVPLPAWHLSASSRAPPRVCRLPRRPRPWRRATRRRSR